MRYKIQILFPSENFRHATLAFLYAAAWRGCNHAGCCLQDWITNSGWQTPRKLRELIMDSWDYYLRERWNSQTRVSFAFPSENVIAEWQSSTGTQIRLLVNRLGKGDPTTSFVVEIAGHEKSVQTRLKAIPKLVLELANHIDSSFVPEPCPDSCTKCKKPALTSAE